MNQAHAKIDRTKVEKFFSWKPQKNTLTVIGAITGVVGLVIILNNPHNGGPAVVFIIIAAMLILGDKFQHKTMEKQLADYYSAVKRAKIHDFANVLRRSYDKTGMDTKMPGEAGYDEARALRDLRDVPIIVDIDPDAVNDKEPGLFERLEHKLCVSLW